MITENDRRLGKRIQKIRKEKGFTQSTLSEKVKLSTKYIQLIESAQRMPSLKALYRIANALDMRVGDLFPF